MIRKIIGVALLATAAGAYFLSKKKEDEQSSSVVNANATARDLYLKEMAKARDLYLKEMAKAGAVIYYFETLVERDGVSRGAKFSGVLVPDNAYGLKTYYTRDNKFIAYTIDELKNLGSSKVATTSTNNTTNTANTSQSGSSATTNAVDTTSSTSTANTSQSGSSVNTNTGAGSSFGMSGVAQLMN